MSKFTDSMGETWSVEFDGLLLDDVHEQTGVDLADLSAGGLAEIEQDATKLVKSLLVLCADEIEKRGFTRQTFSRRIVRDAIENAAEAIVSAAANFFPPKQWSEIQSRLEQQREINQGMAAIGPMMAKLNNPNMPQALRDGVMAAVAEQLKDLQATTEQPTAATTSAKSEDNQSATGQDDTPPMLAPNVLANAGLTPAG